MSNSTTRVNPTSRIDVVLILESCASTWCQPQSVLPRLELASVLLRDFSRESLGKFLHSNAMTYFRMLL